MGIKNSKKKSPEKKYTNYESYYDDINRHDYVYNFKNYNNINNNHIFSYDSMDDSEKVKYISRSKMMKKYGIKNNEVKNIPYIETTRNKLPMYLYKIEDVDMYLLKNPRLINKKKALTIYKLTDKDLDKISFEKRGIWKLYNLNDVENLSIKKHGISNIKKVIYDGKEKLEKSKKRKIKYHNRRKKNSGKRRYNNSNYDNTNEVITNFVISHSVNSFI